MRRWDAGFPRVMSRAGGKVAGSWEKACCLGLGRMSVRSCNDTAQQSRVAADCWAVEHGGHNCTGMLQPRPAEGSSGIEITVVNEARLAGAAHLRLPKDPEDHARVGLRIATFSRPSSGEGSMTACGCCG